MPGTGRKFVFTPKNEKRKDTKDPTASMTSWYHYTNNEGADGIEKDGKIKQSVAGNRDAFHGDGVYLIDKDPVNYSKKDIGTSCWGE